MVQHATTDSCDTDIVLPQTSCMNHPSSQDPSIRRDTLSAQTVVVAPKRANRPTDHFSESLPSKSCAFCAGNETMTPPPILRTPSEEHMPWQARIIPNRYPVVELLNHVSHQNSTRPAHGVHDVIIEARDHLRCILESDQATWRDVWQLIQHRLAMLHEIDGIQWATVFKNAGTNAGASLEHLHSQLVGLDFIPPSVQLKMASLVKNSQSFYQLIDLAEKNDSIIAESHGIIAIIAPAPRQPFETWILPREPDPFFSLTTSSNVDALANLTRTVVAKLRTVLPQVNYNWWLHQAPFGDLHSAIKKHWHWHLEILPRIAPLAGFELGTGCYISTLSPEDAAQQLKHVPG